MKKIVSLAVGLALLAGGCRDKEAAVTEAAAAAPPVTAATAASAPAAVPNATVPNVTVPDITSEPRAVVDAILALQKKGLAVALVAKQDTGNRAGTVIDQTPVGRSSRPKGSVVQLTVATRGPVDLTLAPEEATRLNADTAERLRQAFSGDSTVTVPPVDGRRAIDAMLALQQRGLAINLEPFYEPSFPVLTVASQNPAADKVVPPGTQVEIKCLGTELDATPEEVARLSSHNRVILRAAKEDLSEERARNPGGRN